MLSKKSQAALEFLMTYGWAILVVLVAVGALAYFGVLSPCRLYQIGCPKENFNPEIHECTAWTETPYGSKNPYTCIQWQKKLTRAEMDAKASELCDNLRIKFNSPRADEIYPEYKEKLELMQNSTPKGWIYIPESQNIIENKPRLLRTGIEENPYKWTGNLSAIKSVFCLIPSEICFQVAKNITECGVYQDRMQFNYAQWKEWFDYQKD